jgi:hypothetical protein
MKSTIPNKILKSLLNMSLFLKAKKTQDTMRITNKELTIGEELIRNITGRVDNPRGLCFDTKSTISSARFAIAPSARRAGMILSNITFFDFSIVLCSTRQLE